MAVNKIEIALKEALKKAIPLLKAQGYEFRRIEEKYGTAGKSEID